jgi:hypothetical protein
MLWSTNQNPAEGAYDESARDWMSKHQSNADMVDQCKNSTFHHEELPLHDKCYGCGLGHPEPRRCQTLSEWTVPLYGNLMDSAGASVAKTLASILEVMPMVGTAGRIKSLVIPWGDLTIGCLKEIAVIS